MPMAEIRIIPIGKQGTSIGDYVADAVKAIRGAGLKTQVTAMGTEVEGSLDEILRAARAAHEACIKDGAPRVMTSIHIDDRRDAERHLADQVQAVERRT